MQHHHQINLVLPLRVAKGTRRLPGAANASRSLGQAKRYRPPMNANDDLARDTHLLMIDLVVVPEGGIALDGSRWVRPRYNFFLPVTAMAKAFSQSSGAIGAHE